MVSSRWSQRSPGVSTTLTDPAVAPTAGELIARDGVRISFAEWGSSAADPSILLVHATGFCKELSFPVVDELATLYPGMHAVAIDQRGHGDSQSTDPPFDWWDVGGDITELTEGKPGWIGVGHSAGGAVLLLAELLRPGTFSALALVEPIVFPPPYGRFPDNPMSAGALRRRDRFPSREAAFDHWTKKANFSRWQERAMQAYVAGGLRPDGDEFVLKCSRETEAEFFTAALEHRAWDRLPEIATPTLIVAGEHSTTHQPPFLARLADRMQHARSEIVPDSSHFVWMERPETVAESVANLIAAVE